MRGSSIQDSEFIFTQYFPQLAFQVIGTSQTDIGAEFSGQFSPPLAELSAPGQFAPVMDQKN